MCVFLYADGAPFTWWVGQANETHYYWGGSGPGIQKCACGIERNCTSAKHQCNCDADQRQWWVDQTAAQPYLTSNGVLLLAFVALC